MYNRVLGSNLALQLHSVSSSLLEVRTVKRATLRTTLQ